MATNNPDRVGAFFEDVLQKALQAWRESSSVEALPEDEQIRRVFRVFIEYLVSRLSDLGIDADMVAIQLFRGIIPIRYGYTGSAVLTCWAGPISGTFVDDRYKGESYPFLQWEGPHLRVRRLGTNNLADAEPTPSDTFVTSLDAIKIAKREERARGIERGCERLLEISPNFQLDQLNRRKIAARIVLESTRYTRSLMMDSGRKRKSLRSAANQTPGFPHQDERNILFIPASASGEPIGGAAVFSHYLIAGWVVPLISGVLHLILYRFRFSDEIAAARAAASERARSETVLLYVQRLSHDVKKPSQRAVAILEDVLGKLRNYS